MCGDRAFRAVQVPASNALPPGTIVSGQLTAKAKTLTYWVNGNDKLVQIPDLAAATSLGIAVSGKLTARQLTTAELKGYARSGVFSGFKVSCADQQYIVTGGKLYPIASEIAALYPGSPVALDALNCALLTPQAQGGPGESFGSSKEENNKDGPSEQDPGKDSGSGSPGQGGGTGSPGQKQDKENFDKLEKEIKQKLSESKQFEKIKDQVSITRDKEGLRIEVIDKADFAMYGSGGADMGAKAADRKSVV